MSRLAFVTNFCPHYRVRTFETLADHHDVDYYFFSAGDDWYWLKEHGTRTGRFRSRYLPGFRILGTRVTPTLPFMLWRGRYDAYIKCINGRFALPMTYLAARLARRPFILWTGVWMRLQTPAHRLFFPLTKYIYRHSDAIVVYGDHVKRYLEREGVPEHRIFVAPHAVDNAAYNRLVDELELDALRRELDIDRQTKVLLYMGRLEPEKGLSTLLEAFASLKRDDSVLVLAGAGSFRTRLEELSIEHGLHTRVRFPGFIPQSQTVAYYALAWALVLPSVTTPLVKECWGLVVNEAFNQGLPVVATDAVGAAAGGLVQDGVNGYVVPERDADSLAKALRSLLDDARRRVSMSQAARDAIGAYDNEAMVAGFRRAVEHVLCARPLQRS